MKVTQCDRFMGLYGEQRCDRAYIMFSRRSMLRPLARRASHEELHVAAEGIRCTRVSILHSVNTEK